MLVEPLSYRTPAQKLRIIAAIIVGLVVIAALVDGCQRSDQAKPQAEDLGSGFRRVTIAKMDKGKLGHYPFLFYKETPVCQLVPGGAAPSISPSGNFAVCQDVRSGKLMLVRRQDEKIVPLTTTAFGLASKFVWHEDQGTVEAEVGKEGMSGIFPLR